MAKNLDAHFCKAAPILDWIGNKWTLVVLLRIHEVGIQRFNEIYRGIPSISEKVLSQVLKQLTTDGLLKRDVYPDVPPRVEYSLTAFGETLIPHIKQLALWGRENYETIMTNRKMRDNNAN